jgi:uncharacterized membrane protein YedE/YeeE
MRDTIGALIAGTLFGAGLAIAQMTNPAKVIGFLDVAGNWDPSLAFVMGSALLVSAVAYRLRRTSLATPTAGIDGRLIGGATLFGLGWGLAGFCPGPAIASLITGSGDVALFVVSMIAGMGLFRAVGAGSPRATIATTDVA